MKFYVAGCKWYGVYFSTSFQCALHYSRANQRGSAVVQVLAVEVVTGVRCKGSALVNHLPSSADSAVDNIEDPREYVLFKDNGTRQFQLITVARNKLEQGKWRYGHGYKED